MLYRWQTTSTFPFLQNPFSHTTSIFFDCAWSPNSSNEMGDFVLAAKNIITTSACSSAFNSQFTCSLNCGLSALIRFYTRGTLRHSKGVLHFLFKGVIIILVNSCIVLPYIVGKQYLRFLFAKSHLRKQLLFFWIAHRGQIPRVKWVI